MYSDAIIGFHFSIHFGNYFGIPLGIHFDFHLRDNSILYCDALPYNAELFFYMM